MRPLCKCHGLPMQKNGWGDGGQAWRCQPRSAARDRRKDAVRNRLKDRRMKLRDYRMAADMRTRKERIIARREEIARILERCKEQT